MKKNILSRFFILLVVAFGLAGCQTKKHVSKEQQANVELHEGRVRAKDILAVETQYQTFSTKAKANLSLDGKNHDVTLNIRNEKGKKLWVSVTYIAGIEVARLFITPDSVQMLNRVTSEYLSKPFSFIHQYAGEGVDFNVLEAILLGNSVSLTLQDSQINKTGEEIVVSGYSGKLNYQTIYSLLLKPKSLSLQHTAQQQKLKINYTDYSLVQNRALPMRLSISSGSNGKAVNLNLEYQNPQFDLFQEYPFTVPKRFTIIE